MEEFKRVLKFMFYILDGLGDNTSMVIMQGINGGDILLDVKGCQVIVKASCEFVIKFDQTLAYPQPSLLLTMMKDPEYPADVRKAASCDVRKVVKAIEDHCYMNYDTTCNQALLQVSAKVRERMDEIDRSIYRPET